MKRSLWISGLLTGLVLSISNAAVHNVNMGDNFFSPATVTVTQGDTVRWTHIGVLSHTTTSNSGVWNSGTMTNGSTFIFQFNTVGSFPYHCAFHPSMTGTVVVDQATGVGDQSDPVLPTDFKLNQNYPNPFNATTSIKYQLPRAGEVRLTIYNLLGQVVKVFQPGRQAAGSYTINWDGKDRKGSQVSSGIYMYRLEAGEFSQFRKMTLIK